MQGNNDLDGLDIDGHGKEKGKYSKTKRSDSFVIYNLRYPF
jgi:hypothetical protein